MKPLLYPLSYGSAIAFAFGRSDWRPDDLGAFASEGDVDVARATCWRGRGSGSKAASIAAPRGSSRPTAAASP